MSSTNFAYKVFYSTSNATCDPSSLERVDYFGGSSCTPSQTSTDCDPSDNPDWRMHTGCLSNADALKVGEDPLASLYPYYNSRIQFWHYDNELCSDTPQNITDLSTDILGCYKNLDNFHEPGGAIYNRERVTIDFSGLPTRLFYSDDQCTRLINYITYTDSTSCSSKTKYHRLPHSEYNQRIVYTGPGCTNPSSSDCPTTEKTDAQKRNAIPSMSLLGDSFVSFSWYADNQCEHLDYKESVRLNTCLSGVYNPEAMAGLSYNVTVSGDTVYYNWHADAGCKNFIIGLRFRLRQSLGARRMVRFLGLLLLMQSIESTCFCYQWSVNGGIAGGISVILVAIVGFVVFRRSKATVKSVTQSGTPLLMYQADWFFEYVKFKISEQTIKRDDKQVITELPPNPEDWSISQVANWVSLNGGTEGPVFDQKIDGIALTSLTTEELYIVLRIQTVGERIKFKRAMEGLVAAPPTYSE
ncbi:hypothetical protein BCR33DRAFT_850372 [Rhizoclosmatium globosum]|uniref:SAM domain-containing protein n=1 Tax=Rhizoclosmatium globosum TaxID=329046 RepID=A0A1Y2CCU5_9FUNG|nr:hypothetical protein BCR33DRAFT_850372 [Rhizoclosmatium globosum]|eukprot:ORY44881.1 hypothetical protein BCR33DRAFT_850372 [Rhizoclosmatium globosum]